MPRAVEKARIALRTLWPYLVVAGFGMYLLWPVPLGQMPLSADHTVHLTRAYLIGHNLSHGHLTGWSSTWFFGFPAGELYPMLGDLGVCLLRGLSFGFLEWSTCYAWVVTAVFLLQGWVLVRASRLLGLGSLPGLLAGIWMLLDPGTYREGGFTYTITYGVWPQALSTSLAFWGFAELAAGLRRADTFESRAQQPVGHTRQLLVAGVVLAAALLAHPMALLMCAVGGVLLVAVYGLARPGVHLRTLRLTLLDSGLAVCLAIALSGFWLVPMFAHRGWMVSYGWLYQPLAPMLDMVWNHGAWAHAMPSLIGYTIVIGMVAAALGGSRYLRFVALWAFVHWLLASTDLFWRLRLDWISEGFTHLQYQRFLIAAKPGLYLLAGWVVAAPTMWAARRLSGTTARTWKLWVLNGGVCLAGATAALLVTSEAWTWGHKHGLGQVQLQRLPGRPGLDGDYRQLLAWLAQQVERDRQAGRPPTRIAVAAHRNLHWFMDAPVASGIRLYKQGFTPGSNFVHKPEVGNEEIYRRLGVRYLVSTGARAGRGMQQVATFGRIKVWERGDWQQSQVAELEGPGELRIDDGDPDDGTLAFEIGASTVEHPSAVAPGGSNKTWLVVHVSGYPRWQWRHNGEPVEWIEVPARTPVRGRIPQTATQHARRTGELRGGKAHGDDGTEPMLMAAQVAPGRVELHYRRWLGVDIFGAVTTFLGIGVLALASARPGQVAQGYRQLKRMYLQVFRPIVLALVVLAVAGVLAHRWMAGGEREHTLASSQAWVSSGALAAPLKTDMLIVPALVVLRGQGRRQQPVVTSFALEHVPSELWGWVALDDDDAKRRAEGRFQIRVELCRQSTCTDDQWRVLLERRLQHRPGRSWLKLDTGGEQSSPGQLRVTLIPTGKAPPQVGFNFDLSGKTWSEGHNGGPS